MIVWLHIALFIVYSGLYKPTEFRWIKDIPVKTNNITTDQLNAVYYFNDNILTCISPDDNTMLTFSNMFLGKIYSVDAADPFRVLVFYKDLNKIIFLDNKLSELRSAINLNDAGYYNVIATAASSRGGFWIYDQDLNQLVYFDKLLNASEKSSALSNLFDDSELSKIVLIEKSDFLYLGIPGKGVFLFDIYGTFIKEFPILDFKDLQVVGQNIVYFSNNKLKIYNTQIFETEEVNLPVENIIGCRIESNQLFLLMNDRISIYNIEN